MSGDDKNILKVYENWMKLAVAAAQEFPEDGWNVYLYHTFYSPL